MSGKDEQPIKDFPICPKCEGVKAVWVSKSDNHRFSGICFNNDAFLISCGYKFPKINGCRRFPITLDTLGAIQGFRCSGCRHEVFGIVKEEIIKLAKKYITLERNKTFKL